MWPYIIIKTIILWHIWNLNSTGKSIWSDSSPWVDHRLPSVDSGITGATCCIKAERDITTEVYSWRGEACGALLPAICEFKIKG